jgi:hypothetical protein
MKMNKKAYFFLIDAIIAMFVLAIGVSLIVSSYTFKQPVRQLEMLDADVISTLRAPIRSNADSYCGNGGLLNDPSDPVLPNSNITNLGNSYLQQFAEFYYRNQTGCGYCLELIEDCFNSIIPSSHIEPYSVEFVIDDDFGFGINTTDIENATLLIPQRDIVFGMYGQEAYGPYLVELTLWN